MATINMREVLDDPYGVCEFIAGPDGPFPVIWADVEAADKKCVILHVEFRPVRALHRLGFPDETAGIFADRSHHILTVPHDAGGRSWLHRNPLIGDLCLWYPGDPRGLRWDWEDGFDAYLGLVSKHLQAEEWYRRGNPWPFEDAPHGDGPPPSAP
jgi:hypothetical protein